MFNVSTIENNGSYFEHKFCFTKNGVVTYFEGHFHGGHF